jgi:large subunit ribosomal protein L9
MKVMLLKDVYKLGRAGDVKKVADGYGRNYLLPQGLAVLASAGALKQADSIRTQAAATRAILNEELSGIAEQLDKLVLTFPAKAGETGKLYGSITSAMVAEAVKAKTDYELDRRQLDMQPIRNLGEHSIHVRLTVDLVPVMLVIVHREGEAPEAPGSAETEEPEMVVAPELPAEEETEVPELVEVPEEMPEVAEESEPAAEE